MSDPWEARYRLQSAMIRRTFAIHPSPRTTTPAELGAWLDTNPTHYNLVAFLWATDPNGEYDGDDIHPPVTALEAHEIIRDWIAEM